MRKVEIPVNLFLWIVAFLPILVLFVTIVILGWSASRSAITGMLTAAAAAFLAYRMEAAGLASESVKGVWNALSILLVIWPAIFIYEVTDVAKGFTAIQRGIRALTRHELLQIMILGWIFPDFLQGITGFGVAVAVGAPLLVSIGVKPFWSVVFVLLSYSWGATFGTLAIAWDALVAQTGLAGSEAAAAAVIAAVCIGCFIFVAAFALCFFYGKGKAVKEGLPMVLVLAGIQAAGQLLLAPVNATVSCFVPTTIALVVAVGFTRVGRFSREWKVADSHIMDRNSQSEEEHTELTFHQGFLPYYVLTGITILCLLVPPVHSLLSQWKIGFAFPEVTTGFGYVTAAEACFSPMSPLVYAGTILAEACLVSVLYYGKKGCLGGERLKKAASNTVKKAIPSTVAIIGFTVMARLMTSSGQIYVLSSGIVRVMGKSYVIVAPLVGSIGTFMTSSNMSSNILFAKFQMTAADLLSLPPSVTLALQTTGGAIAAAMAPGSIILGMSTTGIKGVEGKILRTVMPISIGCGVVFGLLSFIFLT